MRPPLGTSDWEVVVAAAAVVVVVVVVLVVVDVEDQYGKSEKMVLLLNPEIYITCIDKISQVIKFLPELLLQKFHLTRSFYATVILAHAAGT